MRPLAEVVARDLVSVERGRRAGAWELGTEHELRLGDDAVARLRFQDGFPSEAETNGHRWTFQRVQQARERPQGPAPTRFLENLAQAWQEVSSDNGSVHYIVRDEEGREVALFWHRHGLTVEFRDGNQLRFERWRLNGSQRLMWIWEDETQEFIRFWEPDAPLLPARKVSDSALAFEIPPTAARFDHVPLLVVLGWYRILRHWEANRNRGPWWAEG